MAERSLFQDEDFRYWALRLHRWFDPTGPAGNHLLEGRRIALTMSTGIYVAVDHLWQPLYVGKVQRGDGGVDSRFAGHHQPVESWDSVWLLPLVTSIPDVVLRRFEQKLIERHSPPGNYQHNRGRTA